jgi:hypothetical protein
MTHLHRGEVIELGRQIGHEFKLSDEELDRLRAFAAKKFLHILIREFEGLKRHILRCIENAKAELRDSDEEEDDE